MVRLSEGQEIPNFPSSNKIVELVCGCGNKFKRTYKSFRRGIENCGYCKQFEIVRNNKREFQGLELLESISMETKYEDLLLTKCSCGKLKKIKLKDLIRGTKSCGCSRTKIDSFHSPKSRSSWLEETPELISSQILPDSWSKGSAAKFKFSCSCGKIFEKKFLDFKTGITKCGNCDKIDIKNGDTAGNFIYAGSKNSIKTKSMEKDLFRCKCGRIESIRINCIYHKNQLSCGKCEKRDSDWWLSQKFGKLRVKDPVLVSKLSLKSNQKIELICDCGQEVTRKVCNISSGRPSCGKCSKPIHEWMTSSKFENLSFPLKREDFNHINLKLLEDVEKKNRKARLTCVSCGNEFQAIFNDVLRGVTLSCGCLSNTVSRQNIEIKSFIESLGFQVESEFDLNGLKYDLSVLDKKILIDFNGLYWHSMPGSKERDWKKYINTKNSEYSFISIYEDEWREKRKIIEYIIKNRIGLSHGKKLRPSSCLVREASFDDIKRLYEEYHYIGSCTSSIHYGVYYEGVIIAGASFRKPSRQNIKYDFEISRMVSNPDFKIHGIWGKLLKKFISDHGPKSIITFSDNRLFTGSVYLNMGMKYSGETRPDYYWVKNSRRFHKSKLRKGSGDTITETELRESQGYRKIWDLGRKRWTYEKP